MSAKIITTLREGKESLIILSGIVHQVWHVYGRVLNFIVATSVCVRGSIANK